MKLAVLNPGGRDGEQHFDRDVEPSSSAHAPVNFHGFAACTGGSFHRDPKRALAENVPVLILIRGDFKGSLRAVELCRRQKRRVVVTLKETGLHQIGQQLAESGRLRRFLQIVTMADACIATTPEAAEIYRHARGKSDTHTVAFIPTPYPLDDRKWDFSITPDKQSGIFIGTREWDIPTRNHAAALLLARQLSQSTGESVTVFNLDGRHGARLLAEL